MPRGRPKGSKNLNAYERGKVKRIREILAQKGITDFDNLRDAQIRQNIYLDTDGGIFVNYEIFKNPDAGTAAKKNPSKEKILNKMEKNLAALKGML
jgi:DNA topoisomerase IB